MRITGIRLTNYGPFKGDHELDLPPGVYAVVAQDTGNPQRSNWLGKCLGGDCLVHGPRGPVPIREFVELEMPVVYGLIGNRVEPVRVIAWHRLGVRRMVSIRLRDGVTQKYGVEHPILTSRGFVRASELKVGDWVAKAARLPSALGGDWTYDDGMLAGMLVADGCRSAHGMAFRVYTQFKQDVFDTVMRAKFGKSTIGKGCRDVTRWLRSIGFDRVTAAKKKIPDRLFESAEALRGFVNGAWICDGYVGLKDELSYSTASDRLAVEMRFVLLQFGIASRVQVKSIDARLYYNIRIDAGSIREFARKFQLAGPKSERLQLMVERLDHRFSKPNVDVVPFEVWGAHTSGVTPGRISSWIKERRGMSRSKLEKFGYPRWLWDTDIAWESVTRVEIVGAEACYDLTLDSREHVYVAGNQFAFVHNSTLLSAVPWALFGKLPDQWDTLDAAISWGEDAFAVDIELYDGMFITRSKRRGQSVQLRCLLPSSAGAERELHQDLAQQAINDRLGCSWEDFQYTSWLGQKDMARIVKADPAERTTVVVNWLALGQLQQAAKNEAEYLGADENELAAHRLRLRGYLDQCQGERATLVAKVQTAEAQLEAERFRIEQSTAAALARKAWEDERDRHARVQACDTAIAAFEVQEPVLPAAKLLVRVRRLFERSQKLSEDAYKELQRLTLLRSGKFDGQCPVMCAVCPVPDQVINAKAAIDAAYIAAFEAKTGATKRYQGWGGHYESLSHKAAAWNRWRQELDRRMAERKTLVKQCQTKVLGPEPPVVQHTSQLDTLTQTLAQAQLVLQGWDLNKKRAADEAELVVGIEHRVVRRRIKLQIFGKGGAQRRIATRALEQIQTVANTMLARHGIDLSVAMQYGKELHVIADVCNCGRAYPKSAKIKQCEVCGAPRGNKWDEKLYIKLSSVSGAAEDLAGVAVQLAAARWRVAARGAAWSVLAIDEPFGSLDAHNRAALAQALAVLAQDGWEQVFVVAHSSDVMDALPHRLLITSDGQWSRVEVA